MTTNPSVIDLGGGRSLSYDEYGPADGAPVVAFHGTPDSRLIWSMMSDEATATGTRLVAFDRPGFGHRAHVEGRTPLDSAEDARRLADALGLDRFSVIGISGGAVHALATAAVLGERVTRVTSFCGWCLPAPEATVGLSPSIQRTMSLVARDPRLALPLAAAMVAMVRLAPDRAARMLLASRPAADRQALEHPQFSTIMSVGIENQFRSPRAIVDEWAQQLPPWPFDLAAIDQPVVVWQGGADNVHPPGMGRHLAATMPNATLRFEPGRHTFDFRPLFAEVLTEAR